MVKGESHRARKLQERDKPRYRSTGVYVLAMKQEQHKPVYAFVEVLDGTIRIHQIHNKQMLKVMQETAEQSGHTYLSYEVEPTCK